MDLDAALMACRLLHYAAVMVLFGAGAYLEVLVPADLAGTLKRQLAPLLAAAIAIAAVTTLLWLALEAGEIGDGWADTARPAMLASVLLDSNFGQVWLWRLTLAGLLVVLPLCLGRQRWRAATLLSGLQLASLAFVGHAAMQEGVTGALHRANHILHLLSAAAWLGALVPLLPCLAALRVPDRRRAAVTALRRFSNAGHLAVALVVSTGIVNTTLILGRWPNQWSSPYQLLLSAKIGLVAMMVLIALINRYGLVPRIRTDREGAIRLLAAGTIAELLLGAGVLALVSVFGTLEPI